MTLHRLFQVYRGRGPRWLFVILTIMSGLCMYGYLNNPAFLKDHLNKNTGNQTHMTRKDIDIFDRKYQTSSVRKNETSLDGKDKTDLDRKDKTLFDTKYNTSIDRTYKREIDWKDNTTVDRIDNKTSYGKEHAAFDDYFEHFDMHFEKTYKLAGFRSPAETRKQQYSAMSNYWKSVDDGIGKYNKLYQNDFNVDELLVKMKTAKIINITFFLERPTIKWILTLEGGQKVLFKPELKATYAENTHCHCGCEHPAYEVTGFAINRMLGLNTMPFATIRVLDWFKDIQPITNEAFTKYFKVYRHSHEHRNETKVCVEWKCTSTPKLLYCFNKGLISGAIMYWVNRDIMELHHFSPFDHKYSRFHPLYFRFYKKDMKAQKLKTGDVRFCDRFRQKAPYNDTSNFLYILDMAVEDFLSQSKNSKHNIMYLNSSNNESINVVIDKGKGFCRFENDLLLAPIYQCCKIRKSVYESLVKINGSFVIDFMKAVHLEPALSIVNQKQLGDVGTRIDMILKYVDTCFTLKGKRNVLV